MRLHVERRGAGRPTAWIHGWSAEIGVWRDFPDVAGREAILFDLPGHGLSPWPAEPFTLEDIARTVLAEVPAGTDFAGWSLGGVVSLACAVLEPAKVRSVAILAMSNFGGDRARRMREALSRDKLRALGEFYKSVWSDGDRRRPGFEALQKDLALKRRLPRVESMIGLYDVIELGLGTLDLGRVACPVFVLHGEADAVAPLERARKVASRIPGAKLVPVPGAGHAPFLTSAEFCHGELDRFWATL